MKSASATILLIDDNAIQAGIRQIILERAGYFAIAVLNPQRALEQYREGKFAEEIDLVITDHIMPGMTGATLVAMLREINAKMPVLVISGLEEAEDEYEGLDVVFRLKPVLPEELLDSVDQLLRKSREQG